MVEQEIIRKRQAGTPVTVESFMAWRANFEAEKNYFSESSVRVEDLDKVFNNMK